MISKSAELKVPVKTSPRETIPPEQPRSPEQPHSPEQPRSRYKPPAPKRGGVLGFVIAAVKLVVWTVVLGGLGYGAYYAISTGQATKWLKGSAPPVAKPKRVIPVETATAYRGDMELFLKQLGSVTALYTVTLHSRVDGELWKVNYSEGQMVAQGDVLAEIDPRPFQVTLQQAEGNLLRDQAALKVAQLDMARYEQLIGSRSITQQQLDAQKALIQQSEGAIKTDEGQIASSKLNLKYCKITAPIGGRIGLRLVDPGNIVHANDSSGLAVITQLQPITVVFTIPQDDIARVQRKVNAGEKLVVDAFDREFKTKLASGTLMAIDNQVDTTTGTVRLKAIFDNADNMLFPNQFVNARLLVDKVHDAVIVPAACVQRGPESMFVYVVKPDDTVELRTVELGPTEGELAVIESGVAADDVVVFNGIDKLQPGSQVLPRDRHAPLEDAKGRGPQNGTADGTPPADSHNAGKMAAEADGQSAPAERPRRSSE